MPLLDVVCSADNTTQPTVNITNYSAGAALRIWSNGWYSDSGGANIEMQNVVPSIMSKWRIQSFSNALVFRDLGVIDYPHNPYPYTAQNGGSSSTIKLNSGSSTISNYYTNWYITITEGVGSGDYRQITGYNGSTMVATVASNWTGNVSPDSTTKYILSPDYSLVINPQGGGASLRGSLGINYGTVAIKHDDASAFYLNTAENAEKGSFWRATVNGHYLTDSLVDDVGIRVNTSGKSIRFGASGTNSTMAISGTGVGIKQSAGTEALEVTGNVKASNYFSTSGTFTMASGTASLSQVMFGYNAAGMIMVWKSGVAMGVGISCNEAWYNGNAFAQLVAYGCSLSQGTWGTINITSNSSNDGTWSYKVIFFVRDQ